MERGSIHVQTENIFPIIKKFLYSDHEIFLRELVSNAVDATQKLKGLAALGEFKGELGDVSIQIAIDKEKKTLTIADKGLGMTGDEVKKYINQVAFSSAGEFLDKFKGVEDGKTIIGHFGLGFYSAFMVADRVEIFTKSYQEAPAVRWECDGSPEFTLEEIEKQDRGTEIVLHINDESLEFLEDHKIRSLLKKYCKFLPIPIQFGEKFLSEEDKKEGKLPEADIVNITDPAWTKQPSSLTDDNYIQFYKELYPFAHEPLFWIHLNVDYPFNLTGILYFPKLNKGYEVEKNKIHLYCNQVFVTDNVGEIVPEYLTLLHGVIDSPDIPLNVSRSYLQSDSNVKKINSHISKKVADKLAELFQKDRAVYEQKWNDIALFVKYGMLSDDKFYERVNASCLLENVENQFFTLEEYKEKIKDAQTDKDGNLVLLYAVDKEQQHSYIQDAQSRGLDVLILNSVIDNHFIQLAESKNEKTQFKRVDADITSNLIPKEETIESVMNDEQKEKLKNSFEEQVDKMQVQVELKPLSPNDAPVLITRNEFMRRMKEMSAMGGGSNMFMMGDLPEQLNLVVNTNHPLNIGLLEKSEEERQKRIKQLYDLALLSQNMLKGEALTNFVKRSFELAI
ncbi:MAG: molecular chaperone HtpG [Chitinophagales bacterium]|nr:molecular chaperone HtpG [Chitinophagales bacterium]